ncbi:hypothetical protein Drorol1_Dr00020222 [Drosera rotundifolia]
MIIWTVHEPHGASGTCFDMDELELEEQERDLGFHGGLGRLLHGFCACFVILLGQMGRTLEEKGKVMMGRLDLGSSGGADWGLIEQRGFDWALELLETRRDDYGLIIASFLVCFESGKPLVEYWGSTA